MARVACLLVVLLICLPTLSAGAGKGSAVKTTVHREGDRVWLESPDRWSWFIGEKESSVHAAQESIMRSLGEDVSYDYLVGVSGLAFRMQVFKEGLCPSSPHPFCGYDCGQRSNEALPWRVTGFGCDGKDTAKCAEGRKMVVESIDRGIPVQYGSEEDGIIVGYQKNGEEFICIHPMKDEGKKTFVETRWPWGMGFFTARKGEIPSKRKLERESLKQAVEMAKAVESGKYYIGMKAWDSYIAQLKALDQADEKIRNDSMLGNAWIYECLTSFRRTASRYLRSITGDFPGEATPHLLRAAAMYEKMADQVLTDSEHCCVTVAPYGWSLKAGQKWTSELRAGQIARMEKAMPLERIALREIEKALDVTPE